MYVDIERALETVWDALACHRENSIPEGVDPSYDDEWDDICHAMAVIREELGLPSEVEMEQMKEDESK